MIQKIMQGVILIFLINSCFGTRNIINPQVNNSDKLRLDGFYYRISKIDGKYIASIYFLYKNGVFRYNGSKEYISEKDLIKKINDFSEEEKNWILQDGKFAFSTWGKWGEYEIINDEIFIKQQLMGAGHRVFQEKGKVINNFTYFISEENNFYPNKIEEYSKSGYYYFRQTVNKPDSLNEFFK